MWTYDYDDDTGTTKFTSHYEDLKRAMARTITPRLPTLPTPSSSSPTPEESTEPESNTEELSLDLHSWNDRFDRSLPELRSLRLGDRSLPSPRTPRGSEYYPPSPRGLPPTPRTPRTPRLNYYPPSPRSRSSSPPKTPGSGRRRVSLSPPKTPRRTPTLDDGYNDYGDDLAYEGWNNSIMRSSRRSSRESGRQTPRTPRTPRTPTSARSPRKSIEKSYPEVVRPPTFLDIPLSARSKMSDKYMFAGETFKDGGEHCLENGVSYYYPEDVRRFLARGTSPPSNEEEGWTRREKLLIVLLLFAIVTVIVLFLVVFLVMSGVLGKATKTEIYNYGQPNNAFEKNVSLSPQFTAITTALPMTNSSGSNTSASASTNDTATNTTSSETSTLPNQVTNVPGTAKTTLTTTTTTKVTSKPVAVSSPKTPATAKSTTVVSGVTPATTKRLPVAATTKAPTITSSPTTATTTRPPTPTTTRPTTASPRTTRTTQRTTTATTTISTTTTTSPTTATTATTTTTSKPSLSCVKPKCVQVGKAIKESLNQATGVDVCSDFYAFACGKNERSATSVSTFSDEFSPLFNVVLEDLYKMSAEELSTPISQFATKGEKIAKAIFASCKATNNIVTTFPAIQEMYTIFRDLGFNTEVTSPLSIDVMQQTSIEKYGAGPLFTVTREPVFDGKQFKYMPLVSPPKLVIDPSLYDPSNPPETIKLMEESLITTVTNLLYSWFAINTSDEPPSDLGINIENRLRLVLVFEKQLKQLIPSGTSDWTRLNTETMKVSELQQLAPAISWSLVLGKAPNDQVRVYSKDYVETLNILLQSTDAKVVKTYIFYNVLFSHAWKFTPKTLRETMMGYLKDIQLTYTDNDCAKLTYEVAFQDALQVVLFAQRETFLGELAFPDTVTNSIVTQLTTTIRGLTWLSQITRDVLNNKLSSLSTLSPDFILKETVSQDFSPDVSVNYSLMTNAINKLRSFAQGEVMLDGRVFDRPEEVRFEFSPLYSVETGDLYFPLPFIHLGSWLKEIGELLPLYELLLTRSILYGLMHPTTRDSWSEPSAAALRDRVTCLSDNVTPTLPDNVDADHLLNLVTAAATLQFINKNETVGAAQELTLGTEVFNDNKRFRFYLLAQGYCSGDVYSRYGEISPRKPKPEVELNFAITNDQHFYKTFICEPGLPMAGENSCPLWDNTFKRRSP